MQLEDIQHDWYHKGTAACYNKERQNDDWRCHLATQHRMLDTAVAKQQVSQHLYQKAGRRSQLIRC